jgi:integrase
MNQIVVRDGKGKKDRITVLPDDVKPALKEHLLYVKQLHQSDLDAGYGRVYLPNALARKYPNADRQWGWQYAFPAKTLSKDPRSGMKRRHHLHDSSFRKSIRTAAKLCGIIKPVSCHTLHSFCHPSAGGRLRYPYGARTFRPQRREYNNDLYSCAQSWR